MKEINKIHEDILSSFQEYTDLKIQDGTVLDDYSYAVSDAIHQAYLEIENNKNPYLYTNISGDNLDDLGYMVQCARVPNEPDDSYKHRLMEWMISCESSNMTSIENALINLEYSSFATYVPLVYGVGTAVVYIIPNSYDNETTSSAIAEVKLIIEKVKSADSYVDYVIAQQKQVKMAVSIRYEDSIDSNYVINSLKTKLRDYINSIPVGDKLEIGEINKIGINEPGISYFVVVQMYIDNQPVNELSYLQTIQSKFVFDEELVL